MGNFQGEENPAFWTSLRFPGLAPFGEKRRRTLASVAWGCWSRFVACPLCLVPSISRSDAESLILIHVSIRKTIPSAYAAQHCITKYAPGTSEISRSGNPTPQVVLLWPKICAVFRFSKGGTYCVWRNREMKREGNNPSECSGAETFISCLRWYDLLRHSCPVLFCLFHFISLDIFCCLPCHHGLHGD